jgi:FlaA1/EpsC-like NDP-sugar epimerase
MNIGELLGKTPIVVDTTQIGHFLNGKNILVTGASGSIGSELVRQICKHNPKSITFFDRNEEKVFYLEKELNKDYPNIKISPKLGSITDRRRADLIFEEIKPEIVFHVAANKHVPLSEQNPHETVANNIGGARNIIENAIKYGCESFIFVSTDKAVNPSSIMGHTKRLTELYIQSIQKKYKTVFTIVRFGNVLGSSGSVVEIFNKQILEGEITLTHPDMTRYFLTIPDACNLLLQSASYNENGIYVLNMGDPIRIKDLANKMIDASGLEVKIKIVGIRQGEKITEELVSYSENIENTPHSEIYKISSNLNNPAQLFFEILLLENDCNYISESELRQRIKNI